MRDRLLTLLAVLLAGLAAGTVSMLLVSQAPAAVTAHPSQHRNCRQTFTVAMGERAALAIYAGGRTVTRRELRVLGYIERCQRNPAAQRFVRWYDRHQASIHFERVNLPAGIIAQAAKTFGIPGSILWFVYGKESTWGENPAGASSGWFGLVCCYQPGWSFEQDADTAASLLARLYAQTGSWPAALYDYSGGSYS